MPQKHPEITHCDSIEPMLSMADIATLTKTSPRTIRQWRAAGSLPPADFELGKTVRWHRSTIEQWIDGPRP